MDILVRPAVADDANAIFRAHKEAIYELCAQDYTNRQIAAWFPKERTADHYVTDMASGERTYIVGVTNNVVAGFCSYQIDDKECHIYRFYTRPDYCGLGIGTALFKALEAAAKDAKCKIITLNASITAHSFYEKMGVQTVEPILYTLACGTEIENFEMEKKVG